MPPKAAGRGAPAPRRPGNPSARSGQQETAPANSSENASGTTSSARPPVQRLQSLNRRAPGGSIGPRGGSLSRDEFGQTKPVLKFAPRSATRRSKEERDAIQRLEDERNQQRLSEAEAIQRARLGNAPRARGAFRGRGGANFPRGGPGAFGAAKRGRGGRFDNDSHAWPLLRHSNSRSHTPAVLQSGYGGYSSDEDEHSSALRISIDQINLDGESEDEETSMKDKKGKRAVKSPLVPLSKGPRPVRVERHEHEERVVSVNTEASSSISADLRRQAKQDDYSDNELFISEEPDTHLDEGEFPVKREPTDGDVLMDSVPHADTDPRETPLPAQPVKARKRVSVKDPRSLLRTKEEIEEFDRHNDDLETLKDILTPNEPTEKPDTTAKEGDEDVGSKEEAKEEDEEPADKNDGRLYLIQFPPLTPNLKVPGEPEPIELQDDSTEDVTIAQDSPRLGEPEVKREEDQEDGEKAKTNTSLKPPGKIMTATQRQLPPGRVGRLNLHKSGRVTLDWGGISFELDKGASVNFVQEAVVASTSSATEGGDVEAGERCVWAMGQLSEKFIASPEWNKLL